MAAKTSLHSICRWTFNAGKGGFVPADIRPAWSADRLDIVGVVELIAREIAPRMPANVQLGFEVHYDTEANERNAAALADAMRAAKMYLGFLTPGAHSYFAYGGVCSLDPAERRGAEELAVKGLDLTYGPLRKTWHPDADKVPTFALWNGSYGYDLASVALGQMYQNLKESVAKACRHEAKLGGKLYMAIEPKPNEGHPAMLLPTVASAIVFWRKLEEEFGISRKRKGVNKEFGHTEMIGLDPVYDTVEEIDNDALVHMHVNSQGLSDGIILGGPGKFDIDHGSRISGMNIAIAGLIRKAGYRRWKGHDMQPRAYDNERQGIERVVRSVISWEACEQAAAAFDERKLMAALRKRETAQAEDMVRAAVSDANRRFDDMMKG